MAKIIRRAGRGLRGLWLKVLAAVAGLFGAANLAACPVALYMPPPGPTVDGRVVRAGSSDAVKGIRASVYNGGGTAIDSAVTEADGNFALVAYGLDPGGEIRLELADLDPATDGDYATVQVDLKAREGFDPGGSNDIGDVELPENGAGK